MLESVERQLCFVCDSQIVIENSYKILYTYVANGKVQLSESIKKIINWDSELITLPNGILCRRCFLLFDELELALIKCRELHETILKYYSTKSEKSESREVSDVQVNNEGNQIIDRNEVCSGTETALKPIKVLQRRKEDESNEGRVSVSASCPECGRVFRRFCNLHNHMRVHNKQGAKLLCADATVTTGSPDCGVTEDLNFYTDNTDSGEPNMCEDKPSENSSRQTKLSSISKNSSLHLKTATVIEGDDDFMWPVPYVDDGSEDKIKLNENDKDEVKNKQQTRKEINEASTKDNYEENTEIKKQPRKRKQTCKEGTVFVCEVCGKQWQRAAQLRLHEATHSDLRPFVCQICGQAYKHKHARDIHVGMHQGINPFICQICGKAFTQKCALQRHLPIHTGEAPYQCEICGKRFVHHTSFNMHTLTHTGEKLYKCKVCGLALLSGSHLKRHSRIHTGERPFACTQCGKRFAEKYNLMAHQKTHNGSDNNVITHRKPHDCKVCGISFDRKPKLEDHLIVCHNKIVDEPRSQWVTQLHLQGNGRPDSVTGETENIIWNNTLAVKKTTKSVEHIYSAFWETS